MDETYNLEAIVLNRVDWRENDSRVTVYSQEKGKLELIARGTKKIKSKIAPHIEPFNLIEVMAIRGRQYDYLGSGICRDAFAYVKSDLDLLSAAGQVIGFMQKNIKEAEPDPQMYLLLKNALAALNDDKLDRSKIELIVQFFIYQAMAVLGYRLELDNCLDCRKKLEPQANFLIIARGGIICPECAQKNNNITKLTITPDCLKILKFLISCDSRQLKKLKIDDNMLRAELNKLISLHHKYYLI